MVHEPVQQSPLATHASPGCAQNDDDWHVPPEQRPEQQSELALHALPTVAHVVLSATHAPAVHVWLQHCVPEVQGRLSDRHCGYWQKPFAQSALQQSPFVLHDAPSCKQLPVPGPPPNTSGTRWASPRMPPSPSPASAPPPSPPPLPLPLLLPHATKVAAGSANMARTATHKAGRFPRNIPGY